MNINIKTIPHGEQDYETVGNWWIDEDGDLQIRVSFMNNEYYEWFVAQHEINEALLCIKDGINEKDVTKYDVAFERLRELYPEIIGEQEPGDMVSSPYHQPHLKATLIENFTVDTFGEDWKIYDKTISKLLK